MKVNTIHTKTKSGFSLIEMLAAIAVLSLLVGVGIPSYYNFLAQKKVRLSTEELNNYMKIAQSQSLNKHSTYYLSLRPGSSWCFGISDTVACDCAVVNSCTVSGVQTRVQSTEYSGQPITLALTGYTGAASNPSIVFNGGRGTVSAAGTASFSSAGLSATISTSTTGLVTICSDNITSYTPCTGP